MTPNGMSFICSVNKKAQAASVETLARYIARVLNEQCSVQVSLQTRSLEGLKGLLGFNGKEYALNWGDLKVRPLNIEEQQQFLSHLMSALYPVA